ncbi:Diheme cytochrome c [Desulfarculus baarsii DSM 2075]|uniref:Diheme cytochrome c n=1 Tax=Desulfarculus baarsii (strain ATCC 33931 / DSM 2075 / LMG 7858 / VKM B-1802 / 2st14) TaxID=644282 RepID=E1QEG2_DESB2|nr:diheme cytochrome c [Desulfarculus baarsii]ADK83948.1 Diheme cytochrome c [Desulfarculus baarsii DSM 2075]
MSPRKLHALTLAIALVFGLAAVAWADHHGHGRKERRDRYEQEAVPPVNNALYKQTCGGCHMAYQPGLLPSGSWREIIAGLGDHFGQDISPDDADKATILAYLEANSAERSPSKRSRKIMDCLGGATPPRISEVPYIVRQHEEIRPGDYKDAQGQPLTPANCAACHTTAEQGVYDDDNVRLPR